VIRSLAAGIVLTVMNAAAGPPGPSLDVPRQRGRAEIVSEEQRWEGDLLIASGMVHLRYRDMVLEADRIELDDSTKDVVAMGNVVLHEGERRIAGERIEFNLDRRVGTIYEVWGFSDPDIFFTAREAAKTGPGRFELKSPTVSSCTQPNPQWRIRGSSGTFEKDRYIRLRNARLEVKGVPILYLPFFQYPAKSERSSGFLFPSIGENSLKGFFVANSFFWAMGRSYDTTVTHEWFSKAGQTLRAVVRYAPSHNMTGVFETTQVLDKETDALEAGYRLTHNQRFGTWRAGATLDFTSDEQIDRRFSNSIERISRRFRRSRAFVENNWSQYSLRAEGIHNVQLSNDLESTDYLLPSVSFGARDTKLFGPVYVALRSNGGWFGREQPESELRNWGRLDLAPTIRAPYQPTPWLSIRPTVAYRLTYYTRSFEPNTGRQVEVDEGFLRSFGAVNLAVVGPIVQRIFNTPDSGYSEKLKHLIEPEIAWRYSSVGDPDGRSQDFDSIDRQGRFKENRVSVTLRNLLFAKRSMIAGAPATPHELGRFELFTTYDFERPEGFRLMPLGGRFRFVPDRSLVVEYGFALDLKDTFFQSQTLQSTWRSGTDFVGITFSRNRNVDAVTSSQIRSRAGTEIMQGRLLVEGGLSYDIFREDVTDISANMVYRTQCCGFGFGYRRLGLSRNDTEYRVSVSLKHIGTVFDYTVGDDGGF